MKNDLTNVTFGRLTAKEIVGKDKRGYLWRCDCTCGGEKVVPASYLRNGHTTSCGCINREKKDALDITGKRWGRLVAIKHVGYEEKKNGDRMMKQSVWLWQCDCGNTKEIPATEVKHGGTRSCGCKAIEHAAGMRTEDITGRQFGRLTAIRPTEERTETGSVIWELTCECGTPVYKTVNELKTGRVLSCGCFYKESRKDCTSYRKDFVDSTCLSSIVAAKTPSALNTSGHTGVYFDKRSQKWQAYINYKKKRYYLGFFKNKEDAIRARKEGEAKIHDPVIMEYFANLTPEKKKEFIEYMKSIGAAVEIGGIAEDKK
ncbi:MAG: AP2 domain-containing protein [Ruminococcaceae bacterium]|nr:AP2 domain-containing protein [Oscillospiraceae bacterium]